MTVPRLRPAVEAETPAAATATCEACGEVCPLGPAELSVLRAAVLEAIGYRARFTHFPLAGLCPECAVDHRVIRSCGSCAVGLRTRLLVSLHPPGEALDQRSLS